MRNSDVQRDYDSLVPTTQATMRWQSFRDYLPSWLSRYNNTDGALLRILNSLKIASESHLETSVSTAEITVSFPISRAFHETLRSAAKSISISIPANRASSAGRLAARYVYSIVPGKCGLYFPEPDDPTQAFLTVEYTRSALTALLIFEECGVDWEVRVLHETDLDPQNSSIDRRAKLTTALGDFIEMPVQSEGEVIKSLSNVVLIGELSQDKLLHEVLKDVLGEQQQSDILTASTSEGKETIDPVFVGSVAAARLDLIRSNYDRQVIACLG